MTAQQAFALAVQHHQAGRLAEAEALYRQILAVQPKHSEAWHRLGVLASQAGRDDAGVEMIRQALAINPGNASAHANLGLALLTQRRFEEAVVACRRAIELDPRYTEAYFHLGKALDVQGQTEQAMAAYRQALLLQPDFAPALNHLGLALASQHRLDEAIAVYRKLLALQPEDSGARNNLGTALRRRGQLHEAVAMYRSALALHPQQAQIQNNLGIALTELGDLDAAVAACRGALEHDPGHPEILNNLGTALAQQGRLDEALEHYRRALEISPGHPGIHGNVAGVFLSQGKIPEAVAAFRQALDLQPHDAELHSKLIYALHFHPQDDRAAGEEQRLWNQRFTAPVKHLLRTHANERNAERRLRIGYVSPDFREHVIGQNLLPLLTHHDQREFEIYCYSAVTRPDSWTDAFRRGAAGWRQTTGISDEALAEMIREDRVDILVDLTQHLAGNRLTVFARQPAPVQVSFAGYPESPGVEGIQYRLSDRWLESEIRNEHVYLLDSFWCYDPRGMEIAVNSLPAAHRGYVTFGSLNNFCKVNEPLLKMWARVLRLVANSRLLLLSQFGSHREKTLEFLEANGVEKPRVAFAEPRPRPTYFELYHRLDIVLDTFPYNGHTTSLDALWMGVPVVSLAGKRPLSRAGLSQLSNLGLVELVAHSEEEFVKIVPRLASDLPRLAELRRSLRPRMEASALMDAPRFARNIEAAYRAMLRRWCEAKARD